MKLFSFFVLFLTVAFQPIIYSKPPEISLTRLQIPFLVIGDPENDPFHFYTCKSSTDYSNHSIDDPINNALYSMEHTLGSVKSNFLISKYEITAFQYCAFLNAVAVHEDPHHLYKKEMSEDPKVACITRTTLTKEDGTCSFYYEPFEGRDSLPITYISLSDSKRFCNWLEHDTPTSQEDPKLLAQCTEEGAYDFYEDPLSKREETIFIPKAHYYIPSQDQWFKAAYYKGGGKKEGYWTYPTMHDAAPNNGQGDVTNQANYRTLATGWTPRHTNPTITPVDCFEKTCSAYGVCDMGGNVAEWTSSLEGEGAQGAREQYEATVEVCTKSIVRGGSWNSQYSIYANNELMATSTPQSYDPLSTSPMIGFRVAACPQEDQESDRASRTMENCSHSNEGIVSSGLWTVFRGIIFGCPRTMLEAICSFFGYDAATLLGVTSVSEMSVSVVASIFCLEMAGFLVVMGGIYLLGQLIPWSSIQGYFMRMGGSPQNATSTPMPEDSHTPITIQETIIQSFWKLIKSLIGCGMCLLTTFLSTLRIIALRLGIDTILLDWIEDIFADLRLLEIPYIPSWIIYRVVPIMLELGFLGLFLFGSYELVHYWPTIQDSFMQLWYGYVNCQGTSPLNLPGVIN